MPFDAANAGLDLAPRARPAFDHEDVVALRRATDGTSSAFSETRVMTLTSVDMPIRSGVSSGRRKWTR